MSNFIKPLPTSEDCVNVQACAAAQFTAMLPDKVVKMSQSSSFLKFILMPGLFHLCLCLGAITAPFYKELMVGRADWSQLYCTSCEIATWRCWFLLDESGKLVMFWDSSTLLKPEAFIAFLYLRSLKGKLMQARGNLSFGVS